MATFDSFQRNCNAIIERSDRQGRSYFEGHSQRFYNTYKTAMELLPPQGKVLSVGAGIAYVEAQLVHDRQAKVTVIDFPEAIEIHGEWYEEMGFHTIGLDLSKEWSLPKDDSFHLALSGEIIEHIPAAPVFHIESLARYLMPDGALLLTTPNLARFMSIWRLLRGQPIAAAPELIFGPVDFEHEFVHRREYVAREIESAMQQAGLQHQFTRYTRNERITRWTPRKIFAHTLETINPRLRETLLVVGKK